jgi:hypothetical protein
MKFEFEDDDPSEKYEVIFDWNASDGSTFISQTQKDLLDQAENTGKSTVSFKDGRKIRINAIKFIRRKLDWQSAEEKKETAKNEYINDLWWKYIHAETEGTLLPVTKNFEDFLRKEVYLSDKRIQQIRERLKTNKNTTFKL